MLVDNATVRSWITASKDTMKAEDALEFPDGHMVLLTDLLEG